MLVGLSDLNLHLRSFNGCLMDILLSSVKEIISLISQGMENIYLKVTIEQN